MLSLRVIAWVGMYADPQIILDPCDCNPVVDAMQPARPRHVAQCADEGDGPWARPRPDR
jgi:hypothetical protein